MSSSIISISSSLSSCAETSSSSSSSRIILAFSTSDSLETSSFTFLEYTSSFFPIFLGMHHKLNNNPCYCQNDADSISYQNILLHTYQRCCRHASAKASGYSGYDNNDGLYVKNSSTANTTAIPRHMIYIIIDDGWITAAHTPNP